MNPQEPGSSDSRTRLPVLALTFNAFVWGVSWYPLRMLHSAGLHPLWTTSIIFVFSVVCILIARPAGWRGLVTYPALWVLVFASGLTNVGFNWAVTVGDVVRVVLLFYLMPGWSVLLAWGILGEVPTRGALLRLVLAFTGLLVVMLPAGGSGAAGTSPLSLADLLSVLGGFAFALNNVMLRRLAHTPGESRMVAMFGGGALLSLVAGCVGLAQGAIAPPPPLAMNWVPLAMALSATFMAGNMALQYAAPRLPAATTSLVMLTEVVFASVSAVLLGGAVLEPRTLIGGALIVLAALLAAWPTRAKT